jgi:photosystem II stability/assembly factor-like uncharacterized protein
MMNRLINSKININMKKLLLLFTFAFCFSAFSFSQEYGWTDISANMPEQGNLNDIHVIGEEVWITGWGDGVFYSPDGGETFIIQPLPENSGITSSVFMKNNQEGYVVTFLGNILKTTDGGTAWTTLHEPGGALNSVHFPPSSNTGYTCGTNGTVWMFDDTSITDISPSGVNTNLQSICFPEDNSDGKVCGQTSIRRYKNNTWANLQFYDGTLNYNSIFFIDNNLGWSCGINGTIIRTNDGSSWVLQESNITIENFNDIFFINSLEGWAAGTEVLSHSVDSGSTWTEELASQTIGVELRAIYFTSAHYGYVVGNDIVLKYGEISGIGETKTLQFEIYPNPAKEKFTIRGSRSEVEQIRIELLDMFGNQVSILYEGNAISDKLEFDVQEVPAGIYYCRFTVGKHSQTKKMVLMK